jgi:hypothetical protein
MAHCDNQLSGNTNIPLPGSVSAVSLVAQDTINKGSKFGLGCVSNGAGGMVACSIKQTTGPNLVVYDGDGNLKWSSSLFNPTASASAPIIDANGGVVAADDKIIARFSPSGDVIWQTTIPGGLPISPVVVNGNTILIACNDGPISLYSFTSGALLGKLTVTDPSGAAYYTMNTPSVNGNAVYVSLQKGSDHTAGELAKILVNPGANPVLSVAWTFPFGGPSGASPHYNPVTNTVYFDGDSLSPGGTGPPVLFAVVDAGNSPQLKWSATMPASMQAAVSQDSRGGVWAFAVAIQYLWRFNEADGTILQTIDVNALMGGARHATYVPSSATTIASDSIMLLGVGALGSALLLPSYVVAVNLLPSAGALVWKYEISDSYIGDTAFGQFPIVIDASGNANVAFTTYHSGAYFLRPSP